MTTGYEIAKTMLGLQEYRDRQKLMDFFLSQKVMSPADPTKPFNPDGKMKGGLPWCAAFVTACERKARGLNKAKVRYAAREFGTYGESLGKDLTKVKEGDILIFTRGSNSWEGHVGYYAGMKDGFIRVCGGNQSDSVSYAYYDKKRLIDIRRVNV